VGVAWNHAKKAARMKVVIHMSEIPH